MQLCVCVCVCVCACACVCVCVHACVCVCVCVCMWVWCTRNTLFYIITISEVLVFILMLILYSAVCSPLSVRDRTRELTTITIIILGESGHQQTKIKNTIFLLKFSLHSKEERGGTQTAQTFGLVFHSCDKASMCWGHVATHLHQKTSLICEEKNKGQKKS